MSVAALPQSLKVYSHNRAVRAAVILLVTAIVAYVQYRLAHLPLPVDVSVKKKELTVRSGEQLILEGLAPPQKKAPLFSYQGNAKEVVDVHIDQGAITNETRSHYQLDPRSEVTDNISYTTRPP